MCEPHDLNGAPDAFTDEFEARLAAVRSVPARLDRDRLMYLAGRRAASPARRGRLWPALTMTSWAVCAALVGLLIARPAKVVTETRVVERIVEVPVVAGSNTREEIKAPAAVAAAQTPSPIAKDWDLAEIDLLRRPLAVLSSRPVQRQGESLAVAEPVARGGEGSGTPPASYADLRRELLPAAAGSSTQGDGFRWF